MSTIGTVTSLSASIIPSDAAFASSPDETAGTQSGCGTHRAGHHRRSAFERAAEAAGLDANQVAALRQQIGNIASKAAASGDTNGAKRQAVRAAVTDVLKENGIDPAAFHHEWKSLMKDLGLRGHGHHHHGHDHDGDDQPDASLAASAPDDQSGPVLTTAPASSTSDESAPVPTKAPVDPSIGAGGVDVLA